MQEKPVFANLLKLSGERAWRTYTGGKLLDRLHGRPDGEDGHFPEEWIMSVVNTRTGRGDANEGLSRLADNPEVTLKSLVDAYPAEMLGAAHAAKYGASTGVLLKLIDSSERLSVQVHPTREKAMRLFQSPFGKTECWHILGGREVNGQSPCVYLGFKPGVTESEWKKLFARQDVPGMLDCLHRFEPKAGDTILIEGGIPHAIGPGCFLAEIQEPTDFTIRVDRVTPSGYELEDFQCHQGLGFEKMFECFDYTSHSAEETRARWFIQPRILGQDERGEVATVLGYDATPYFRLDVMKVKTALPSEPCASFFGVYVLEGKGALVCGNARVELGVGDQCFIPAAAPEVSIEAGAAMKLLRFFGPRS
jgi:mannose-6-phosphate isomerase